MMRRRRFLAAGCSFAATSFGAKKAGARTAAEAESAADAGVDAAAIRRFTLSPGRLRTEQSNPFAGRPGLSTVRPSTSLAPESTGALREQGLAPEQSLADLLRGRSSTRRLRLFNAHTLEGIDIVYYRRGSYDWDALRHLNVFFRDWRENAVIDIDRRVLDVLHVLQMEADSTVPLHILSAFRTPRTNAMLARVFDGVAHNSFHMVGRAIDLFLPGHNVAGLRRSALDLGVGGVGYYPHHGFLHVDSGPVRTWG